MCGAALQQQADLDLKILEISDYSLDSVRFVFCLVKFVMDLRNFQNMLAQQQQNQAAVVDAPVLDTSEKVTISSLALLKMLKHGIHTSLELL